MVYSVDCFAELTRFLPRLKPMGFRAVSAVTDDPTTDTTDESTGSPLEESDLDREELEREYPEVVGDIPELIDEAHEGNQSTLYRAIAEYERVLAKVARGDALGGTDLLHDLRFAYYESLADGLDTVAETSGWDVLVEFANAYGPHEQGEFPEVGHVIANALGRSVIRTLAHETGVADGLPVDWSLQDLEVGLMSEMLDTLGEATDS